MSRFTQRYKPWHLRRELDAQVTYCGLSLRGDNAAVHLSTVLPKDATCKRCLQGYERRFPSTTLTPANQVVLVRVQDNDEGHELGVVAFALRQDAEAFVKRLADHDCSGSIAVIPFQHAALTWDEFVASRNEVAFGEDA